MFVNSRNVTIVYIFDHTDIVDTVKSKVKYREYTNELLTINEELQNPVGFTVGVTVGFTVGFTAASGPLSSSALKL